MRVPVAGGAADLILSSNGPPAFIRARRTSATAGATHATTAGNPAFRCAARPDAPCVLSEEAGSELVFSSFEPAPGAKRTEIFRMATENASDLFWDLSGDGRQLAYGSKSDYSRIRIRDLAKQTVREISIPQWPELRSVGWSTDGKSLFVADWRPQGSSLLNVTLDGRATLLYKGAEPVELLRASPDGRYLAFGQVVSGVNVWLIEGVPH